MTHQQETDLARTLARSNCYSIGPASNSSTVTLSFPDRQGRDAFINAYIAIKSDTRQQRQDEMLEEELSAALEVPDLMVIDADKLVAELNLRRVQMVKAAKQDGKGSFVQPIFDGILKMLVNSINSSKVPG